MGKAHAIELSLYCTSTRLVFGVCFVKCRVFGSPREMFDDGDVKADEDVKAAFYDPLIVHESGGLCCDCWFQKSRHCKPCEDRGCCKPSCRRNCCSDCNAATGICGTFPNHNTGLQFMAPFLYRYYHYNGMLSVFREARPNQRDPTRYKNDSNELPENRPPCDFKTYCHDGKGATIIGQFIVTVFGICSLSWLIFFLVNMFGVLELTLESSMVLQSVLLRAGYLLLTMVVFVNLGRCRQFGSRYRWGQREKAKVTKKLEQLQEDSKKKEQLQEDLKKWDAVINHYKNRRAWLCFVVGVVIGLVVLALHLSYLCNLWDTRDDLDILLYGNATNNDFEIFLRSRFLSVEVDGSSRPGNYSGGAWVNFERIHEVCMLPFYFFFYFFVCLFFLFFSFFSFCSVLFLFLFFLFFLFAL